LSAIISSGGDTGSIIIDSMEYNGVVYKCKTLASGVCIDASVYWAQKNGTTCTTGKVVVTGGSGGGFVCGQNAGTSEITNVDSGGGGSGGPAQQCPNGFTYALVDSYRYFCYPNTSPDNTIATCPTGFHVDTPQTYNQSTEGWICENDIPDQCNNSCVYPAPCSMMTTLGGVQSWSCFNTFYMPLDM